MSTKLHVYNSLTKQVEPFESLVKGKATVYHCGPTVYKRQHLGNMRRFLFADFLRRGLEFAGYEVREITNITDVGHLTQDELDAGEDKLAAEARKQKVTPQDIAKREIKQFQVDLQTLNIQPSHKYPRATHHIKEMQDLIAELIAKQQAYQTKTGIYFAVTSFPQYGKLSGNTLEDLQAGKRIAIRNDKKHPADFVLWVFDDQALQKWDSPWGTGYPGWHIECSAMSMAYLPTPIDIHTGGVDNKFPHHENEIAQSEAATGRPFVRYWLHNELLKVAGQKLAKRAGEQLTLDTLSERGFSPLAFRLLVFGAHYRQRLDFSWEALAAAQENLNNLERLARRLGEILPSTDEAVVRADADSQAVDDFATALANDLNTPQALAVVNSYLSSINQKIESAEMSKSEAAVTWATLLTFDRVLGLFGPLLTKIGADRIPPEIKQLAEQREQARSENNFAEADRLRVEIEQAGFTVEDTNTGPRLIKKAGNS